MMDRNALKPLLTGGTLALGLIAAPGDRGTPRGAGPSVLAAAARGR